MKPVQPWILRKANLADFWANLAGNWSNEEEKNPMHELSNKNIYIEKTYARVHVRIKKISKRQYFIYETFLHNFLPLIKEFLQVLFSVTTTRLRLSTQVFVRKNRFYRSEHPQLSSCLSIVLLCFYTLTIQTMNKLYMYRQRHFFKTVVV